MSGPVIQFSTGLVQTTQMGMVEVSEYRKYRLAKKKFTQNQVSYKEH